MKLVWCACGKLVIYPGEDRCEDCWADGQFKYRAGRSQAVLTMAAPDRETSHVSSLEKPVHPRRT